MEIHMVTRPMTRLIEMIDFGDSQGDEVIRACFLQLVFSSTRLLIFFITFNYNPVQFNSVSIGSLLGRVIAGLDLSRVRITDHRNLSGYGL